MANPWDAPPYPERGNRSEKVLYEAIGRAVMTWEELERTLARLYAALCEKSQYDSAATRDYGAMLNFRDRLAGLNRAGERYFVKRSNQPNEGELCQIIAACRGYAERRNDIAHGIVEFFHMVRDPSQGLLSSAGPLECCLVPQHFRGNRHTPDDVPKYVLSSREINRMSRNLWPLMRRAHALAIAVELPRYTSRRKFFVPPPSLQRDQRRW